MTDNLVHLREGTGSAIVCVHAAGGLATGFRRLVPHLRMSGPVLALENIEPGPDNLCSIQALADSYWQQVKPLLTDGLILVGWSFGGPVVVEMARLAEASSYRVEAVVLLDAAAPHLLGNRAVEPLEDLAALFEVDIDALPPAATTSSVEDALDLIAEVLARRQAGITSDDLRPFADVYAWHLAALRASGTLTAPIAPVVLVRAEFETGWHDAPVDLGWSEVLGYEPEVLWTAGTHHTLVAERHAPALATLLEQILASHIRDAGSSTMGLAR